MQDFECVYIDSGPDIHFFALDFEFGFIDRDRLPPGSVGLEQMGEAVIPVVYRYVTAVNERFDAPEGHAGVVRDPSEDTLLGRRVLAGKYFFLTCLLDDVVEHC